jgi:hypothetical protein
LKKSIFLIKINSYKMTIETLKLIHESLLSTLQTYIAKELWVMVSETSKAIIENQEQIRQYYTNEANKLATKNWIEYKPFTQLQRGDKIKLTNGIIFTVTGGVDKHPIHLVNHCWHEKGSVAAGQIESYLPVQQIADYQMAA